MEDFPISQGNQRGNGGYTSSHSKHSEKGNTYVVFINKTNNGTRITMALYLYLHKKGKIASQS